MRRAGGLYNGPYSPVAVARYTHVWLPMLAGHPDPTSLVPPLDVAYVWLCHRLAPERYAAYCRSQFAGRVLEPATPAQALAFDDGTRCPAMRQTWKTWADRAIRDAAGPAAGPPLAPPVSGTSYWPPDPPLVVTMAQKRFSKRLYAESQLQRELDKLKSLRKWDVNNSGSGAGSSKAAGADLAGKERLSSGSFARQPSASSTTGPLAASSSSTSRAPSVDFKAHLTLPQPTKCAHLRTAADCTAPRACREGKGGDSSCSG